MRFSSETVAFLACEKCWRDHSGVEPCQRTDGKLYRPFAVTKSITARCEFCRMTYHHGPMYAYCEVDE
jgi:hypothetical protein